MLANAVQELAARTSLGEEALSKVRAENAELRTRLERLEALVAGGSDAGR